MSNRLMTNWLAAMEAPIDWNAWLTATYDVYREVAPHLDVRSTAWWAEVRALATAAPERVRLTLELLDALAARDGPRLWPLVQEALGREDHELPLATRTVAGAIALELNGASGEERRRFVAEHMANVGNGETNEEYAYRVIRSFVAR
jgi:hypothetical protein